MDMTESIAPKSDQLNADDLLSGPRTFTVSEVRKGSDEQPVDVHLAEFPGRPFRPSKSMRRVMVHAWGPNAATYVGKRLTLYRDPEITFGRDKVGGLRISHMSDIAKPVSLALTVTRGRRAPFTVQPLPAEVTPAPVSARPDSLITATKREELGRALRENGIADATTALAHIKQVTGRAVLSTKELTDDEADAVIASFTEDPQLPDGDQ